MESQRLATTSRTTTRVRFLLVSICLVCLVLTTGCRSHLENTRGESTEELKKEALERKQALDELDSKWRTEEPDHVALARIMVDRKLYDVALRLLRESDAPDSAERFYLEGVCHREKSRYETAILQFKKAIELSPRYSQAYEGIALTHDLMGQRESAHEYYAKAIEENPSSSRFYNNFGVSLLVAGRYEEAAERLETCVRLDPESLRAFNNLGLAYGLAGREEDALKAFLKAGDTEHAYRNMAFMYRVRGNKEKSREMVHKALEPKDIKDEGAKKP